MPPPQQNTAAQQPAQPPQHQPQTSQPVGPQQAVYQQPATASTRVFTPQPAPQQVPAQLVPQQVTGGIVGPGPQTLQSAPPPPPAGIPTHQLPPAAAVQLLPHQQVCCFELDLFRYHLHDYFRQTLLTLQNLLWNSLFSLRMPQVQAVTELVHVS